MRELTPEEQAREVGKIDGAWPLGHVLPMKNLYNSKIGFMYLRAGAILPTVFEGNFTTPIPTAIRELPRTEFNSIEEAVKAGWVGD